LNTETILKEEEVVSIVMDGCVIAQKNPNETVLKRKDETVS